MAFGYLCQGPSGRNSTLGLYRFEVKDDKETKMKRITLTQLWVQNL